MIKSTAIIGLGVLGSAIAQYLLNNGFQVYGFDISKKAVSKFENYKNFYACSSISEIFTKELEVLSCLPSATSLYEVVKAVPNKKQFYKSNSEKTTLLIELSTLPVDSKEYALELARKKNIRIVDSPLSGNRVVALQGKLSAYLSGDIKDVQRARPILKAFCHKVTEVGEFGNGSKMKLIGNILNLVHNSVTAEVMVLGMKVGLAPELIHNAISGTFSSSAVFEGRGRLMVENNYAVEGMNFSTPIKDSEFITKLAKDHFVPLPIYQVALQYYLAAMAQGYQDLDAAAVCAVLEKNTKLSRKK